MWSRWKQRVSVMALLLAGLYAFGFVFLTFYEHSYSGTHPLGMLSMEAESRRLDTSGAINNTRPDAVGSIGPISLLEFWAGHETGNPLIDKYGAPGHELAAGGLGRGVAVSSGDQEEVEWYMQELRVNALFSDIIPLNRVVPDSRIDGCADLTYPNALPRASIIITFYNEWPSLLLRTVYSIINRSPRHLIREILLIDDASTMESLQGPLEDDIKKNFPENLIVLLRMSERKGLIAARMRGAEEAKGDVLVFFDSHMEVNVDWLQPLLLEVSKDSNTVAMATLDYIDAEWLSYTYKKNYFIRYGWSWNMTFFGTHFRPDQIGEKETDPRPGPTMVGSAFAIDRAFFFTLGGYDEDMTVWGGENLEMSWRVWLCGGRLMHVPCSRIGHITRLQPYTFPGGRDNVTYHNYERAMRVWMGNYSRFVHNIFPDMKNIDVGDLSKRLAIKEKLQCKDFKWYLQNVWPELNPYDEDVQLWGRVKSEAVQQCLDNANYLFSSRAELYIMPCIYSLHSQGFSLTLSGQLRTTLQCVVPFDTDSPTGGSVELISCLLVDSVTWEYTKASQLMHVESGRCLDIERSSGDLSTSPCDPNQLTQIWTFMQDFPLQ